MLKFLRPRSGWNDSLVLLAFVQFLLILLLTRHSLYTFVGGGDNSGISSTFSKSPPVHIVLTASLSYTLGLVALVNSTLSNASPSTLPRLRFHIVSSSLDEAEKITRSVEERFGARVEGRMSAYGLLEAREERLEVLKVWAGYRAKSLSQPIVFARYLLPDLLPASVDRVIYLDLDVLVQKDLAELWDVDLEGHLIAAARLCRPSALWRRQFLMQKPPIASKGFDESTCTLNNGVLVYDLRAWRAAAPSYTDQLFEWTRLNGEDKLYNLGSQPPFNLVFYRNYKVLDDRWNLMDIAGLREETEWGRGLPWTRSRDEVLDAAILHWNGVIKPWMCDGEGYYSELWAEYYPDFRDFLELEEGSSQACSNLVITLPPAPSSVEQFTVVIVSFTRVDTLLQIAQNLQRSIYVKEILLAWNDLEVPCPTELVTLPWVRCLPQVANLVHNRFLVWPEVTTEAVLHYGDDLLAPLEDLEAAFQIWRRHRDQVLGFEPRLIVCDGDARSGGPEVTNKRPTDCHYRFQLAGGHFDLVTGKLFFVSRTIMQAYSSHTSLLALSTHSPCEALGISFLAAHAPSLFSPRPPLLFKSNLTQLHSAFSSGISRDKAWVEKRHECVQKLVEMFGRRPGRQESFYEMDRVRRRVYKLGVREWLGKGWCSDAGGSRECRSP